MSVGANIKKRRFEMKLSQQDLADAMGYKTRSTIAKIESGENDVSHKKLIRFAEVLDTTPEALVSGVSPLPEPVFLREKRNGKNAVIILAGGKSSRNSQNIPSQFVDVHGKPILVYCMEVYQQHPSVDDIYIVCLKGWESIVTDYARSYGITKLRDIIGAGASGILSLQNGVRHIQKCYAPNDLIIIQEATRPMVRPEMISEVLQAATEHSSATICHAMTDYVQFNTAAIPPKYIDRNSLIALQSPEAHRLSLIEDVFLKAEQKGHTLSESCCTMLLYNLGYPINFIESSVNNIKVTREEDIAAFAALIKNQI